MPELIKTGFPVQANPHLEIELSILNLKVTFTITKVWKNVNEKKQVLMGKKDLAGKASRKAEVPTYLGTHKSRSGFLAKKMLTILQNLRPIREKAIAGRGFK